MCRSTIRRKATMWGFEICSMPFKSWALFKMKKLSAKNVALLVVTAIAVAVAVRYVWRSDPMDVD